MTKEESWIYTESWQNNKLFNRRLEKQAVYFDISSYCNQIKYHEVHRLETATLESFSDQCQRTLLGNRPPTPTTTLGVAVVVSVLSRFLWMENPTRN